jgi:hypothetical protein
MGMRAVVDGSFWTPRADGGTASKLRHRPATRTSLVEWCVTTGEFDEGDRAKALRAIREDVEFDVGKAKIQRHRAEIEPLHRREKAR